MKFNRLENLIGSFSLEKMKDSTVLVIGLGGVGGYVVEALARSGVGNLILVDFDKVDITNFNRQIIALDDNVGKYKVDCFKERIESINEYCNGVTYNLKIDNDNMAIMLFTSGTTSQSKAVQLSHTNICTNVDFILNLVI